jgi:hypothetical protein
MTEVGDDIIVTRRWAEAHARLKGSRSSAERPIACRLCASAPKERLALRGPAQAGRHVLLRVAMVSAPADFSAGRSGVKLEVGLTEADDDTGVTHSPSRSA